MTAINVTQAATQLRSLESRTSDPSLRAALHVLGDAISVGDISQATGVAIGRNIRQVVNHFELSPEAAVALVDLRAMLGTSLGLDTSHYQWGALVVDATRDFVGRAYVFDAVERFLAANASGYFIVQGDPGFGKSTLLSEYVRRTGCIAHFNIRSLGVTAPAHFLQNVCAQLIADAALPYTSLPSGATSDGAFLLRLLREARQQLPPDERLVIAVDALDEVDTSAQSDGANILFLPTTLPDGVYFVMTRRNADVTLMTHAPQQLLDLTAHAAENRGDIEAYLWNALRRPALRAWVAGHGLTDADFVATLADLSESNFMYLHYVLPELESGAYKDLSLDRLPIGLQSYYEDHWRHMGMTATPLPRTKIRIIYVLCEARQPISRQLLSRFATDDRMQIDELAVQEVLEEWRQFLRAQQDGDEARYALYHASFSDFLHRKDIVRATGTTIEGINELIAAALWQLVPGDT